MLHIDPECYGSACASLLQRDPLSPLGPGSPNDAVRAALERLDVAAVVGEQPARDVDMAHCCIAALWLRHDFLDASHSISQGIASTSGSFWHGIMHRREPDYSNAKYWFRRVGDHPLYGPLLTAVRQLVGDDQELGGLTGQATWDAVAFVDLCAEANGSGKPIEETCRRIADLEWQLLFDYCYRQATGGLRIGD